jgi:ATP-dependent protease ClpP protease subunit|tara:strand:- start:206 stop:328 length:123 start_codon:yes stop_codon:yes gene_type:complete
MPAQVVPVIIGTVAVFAAFILAVGWAALRTALPRRPDDAA